MKIYSVSEYRKELNELLGQVTVMIQGEVSDFRIARDRFVWFTLVDKEAAVQCFMLSFQLDQPLQDGMEIRVVGSPTMFAKGQLVFRPRRVELVGEGTLRRAYELLHHKLEVEGLFDAARKRRPPRFPACVGLLTSGDAAAYSDFLRILDHRWTGVEVRHVNVPVQGARAAQSIVAALGFLNAEHRDLDCVVITRGGGSLEDLQAFNTEALARAVFASRIPVVTAVGHERDVTLVDFVADVRAATPTHAAELLFPHRDAILSEIHVQCERIEQVLRQHWLRHQEQVDATVQLLASRAQMHTTHLQTLQTQLHLRFTEFVASVTTMKERTQHFEHLLRSLNPFQLLRRGYSITRDHEGKIVNSAQHIAAGDRIVTQFADGSVSSLVDMRG